MMAVSVNTVRQEGKIDPAESYVTVHEQFSGNYREGVTYIDEKTGRTVHQLGGVDRKYTFLELFEKGYVPVTIQELRDPAPAENVDVVDSAKEFTVDTITAGSFSSLAKIDMVTIVITDEAGNVVQEATAYAKEETHLMFRLEIFEDPQEAPVIRGGLDLDALSPGKYHCKTDCYIGSGDVVTVRDFDFTVE